MSWITKTAGWLAIVMGFAGYALGMFEAETAALLITNGLGYIGVDRKFARLGLNGGGTAANTIQELCGKK